MNSGIFLTYPVHYGEDHKGIKRKIDAQIKAFNNNGFYVIEKKLKASEHDIPDKILRAIQWLPFVNVWPRWTESDIQGNYDFIYMRRPSAMSASMRNCLSKLKQDKPGVKIIMEIPTFPYDKEYVGIKKLLLLKDKYNRKRLLGLIDAFAIVGNNKPIAEFCGIPVIEFENGVDIESINPARQIAHSGVRILCVAMFAPRHGYERLIKGLHKYLVEGGRTDYEIHFVGSGKELQYYRSLVSKYNLDNCVYFHGDLYGEDLERMYASSDIAAGSFGLYKVGVESASALKISESFARGLPVINGSHIAAISEDAHKFYLEFENNSSIVDFKRIDSMWNGIAGNIQETKKTIIDYAYRNFDLSTTMKPVFKYLLHESK